MFDLSIIIVNWNTRDLLAQCLESVYTNTQDISFEVFIVDNASTDGSAEMMRERFPQARLIENAENVGFARANNQALMYAQGRYLLLLNSDAELLPGMVEQMITFMEEHPDAGVLGGKLIHPDGSLQACYIGFPSLWLELLLLFGGGRKFFARHNAQYSDYPRVREVDWIGGASLLVRKRALAEVGLLDERFFLYVEEMELCYRMKRCGWKIYYLSTLQTIHHGGRSSRQIPAAMAIQLVRSKLIFFKTHYGPARTGVLMAAACCAGLVRMLVGGIGLIGPWHEKKYALRERFWIGRGMIVAVWDVLNLPPPKIPRLPHEPFGLRQGLKGSSWD